MPDCLGVSRPVLDAVVGHAREAAPAECCGVLLGSAARVAAAVRARNVAEMPATRFLIAPADHFAAIREARRLGVEVVGFYHSHPGSAAVPSATDLAEASYPDHLYLIVSLAASAPDVRLYRSVADAFVEVPFAVVD